MDKHTKRFIAGLEALRDRHAKYGSVEIARQVQARIQHIRARYN